MASADCGVSADFDRIPAGRGGDIRFVDCRASAQYGCSRSGQHVALPCFVGCRAFADWIHMPPGCEVSVRSAGCELA